MEITFCRTRTAVAESVNEVWAQARRREGSLLVEIAAGPAAAAACDAALAGGLLPILVLAGEAPSRRVRLSIHDDGEDLGAGNDLRDAEALAAAFVASPGHALRLAASGVAGARITVAEDESGRARLVEALARVEPMAVRARGRSTVAELRHVAALPGLDVPVSVLVNTPAEAAAAVADGATDLILRDWDDETLADLRDLVPAPVAERSALRPAAGERVRTFLSGTALARALDQLDGSGYARPRADWAPGLEQPVPVAPGRISLAWRDAAWIEAPVPTAASLAHADVAASRRAVLLAALDGVRPTRDEIELLFRSRGREVEAVAAVADELRRRAVGDTVTYVVNRNINYTNQCYFRCGFCGFSKGPRSLNLRGDPYLLEIEEVVRRSTEAVEHGATEVCLQGGIHPEFTGRFYVDVTRALKAALPDLHVHGYTPLEVWQGAETAGLSVREMLEELKAAGLGTLPGTAAEVLDDDIRRDLCPDKIRTAQWVDVMLTAHDIGLRATSTLMFGHIDGPVSWANHLDVLRRTQAISAGVPVSDRAVRSAAGVFTEFVPLPFVHMGAPIYLRGNARPGPTWDETVLVHSVARIAFAGLIDNIQTSWVKLGLDGAARMLEAGCNDLGGTLMNESISRAAGASHGQEATPAQLVELIERIGRVPQRRSTLYDPLPPLQPELMSGLNRPL